MVLVSSTLAWKIPWMEEPGRLQSMGSLRVGHDWATSLSLFTFMHWRRRWQPTPVFLPGECQRRGSLVGCHLWGRTESDTTAAAASSSDYFPSIFWVVVSLASEWMHGFVPRWRLKGDPLQIFGYLPSLHIALSSALWPLAVLGFPDSQLCLLRFSESLPDSAWVSHPTLWLENTL